MAKKKNEEQAPAPAADNPAPAAAQPEAPKPAPAAVIKVQMVSGARGPKLALDAGKVYELDRKFAEELLAGGFAVLPKEKAVDPAAAAREKR